jgi:hypothetical protein
MTTTAATAAIEWQALSSHINRWFYKADIQALSCILAACAAHYDLTSPPVWLFVVGPSSSGKTRICVDPLESLSHVWPMGDLTSKTFISAFADYKGLLFDIKESGILTFKDFTTTLSKREDERAEIAAQLREIYDGKFTRRTGVDAGATWRGKITIVAGATEALERAWSIKRELGERFLIIRWPSTSDRTGLRLAASQRGRDPEISKQLQLHCVRFIQMREPRMPDVPEVMIDRLACYAQLLATMRGQVIRESSNGHQIIDAPVVEDAYRIHKSLCTLVASHAALWHREPCEEDLAIGRRAALDSIPKSRRAVFECFRSLAPLAAADIQRLTRLPYSSIEWIGGELKALGVLLETSKGEQSEYSVTPELTELMLSAGITD